MGTRMPNSNGIDPESSGVAPSLPTATPPGGTLSESRAPGADPAPQDLCNDKLLLAAPRMQFEGRTVPSLGGIPLLARLGHGGMACVYFGIHPRLDRKVAVKVLSFHLADVDPGMLVRFQREAKAAARIHSPYLTNVLDVNQENGLNFLVMEYVSGTTAFEHLRDARSDGMPGLPDLIAMDICIAATKGLAAAHREGIIHRDIKPENILVPTDSQTSAPLYAESKLSDLGLARSENTAEALTGASMTLGTPGYASPEQTRSATLAGKPSDVFSMGATLYALLCGKPPFVGESAAVVMLQTIQDPHVPLTRERTGVSPSLIALIDRCLVKDPNARFADAGQLLQAMQELRIRVENESRPAARPEPPVRQPAAARSVAQPPTRVRAGPPVPEKAHAPVKGSPHGPSPSIEEFPLKPGSAPPDPIDIPDGPLDERALRVKRRYEELMAQAEAKYGARDYEGAKALYDMAMKLPGYADDESAAEGSHRSETARTQLQIQQTAAVAAKQVIERRQQMLSDSQPKDPALDALMDRAWKQIWPETSSFQNADGVALCVGLLLLLVSVPLGMHDLELLYRLFVPIAVGAGVFALLWRSRPKAVIGALLCAAALGAGAGTHAYVQSQERKKKEQDAASVVTERQQELARQEAEKRAQEEHLQKQRDEEARQRAADEAAKREAARKGDAAFDQVQAEKRRRQELQDNLKAARETLKQKQQKLESALAYEDKVKLILRTEKENLESSQSIIDKANSRPTTEEELQNANKVNASARRDIPKFEAILPTAEAAVAKARQEILDAEKAVQECERAAQK